MLCWSMQLRGIVNVQVFSAVNCAACSRLPYITPYLEPSSLCSLSAAISHNLCLYNIDLLALCWNVYRKDIQTEKNQ